MSVAVPGVPGVVVTDCGCGGARSSLRFWRLGTGVLGARLGAGRFLAVAAACSATWVLGHVGRDPAHPDECHFFRGDQGQDASRAEDATPASGMVLTRSASASVAKKRWSRQASRSPMTNRRRMARLTATLWRLGRSAAHARAPCRRGSLPSTRSPRRLPCPGWCDWCRRALREEPGGRPAEQSTAGAPPAPAAAGPRRSRCARHATCRRFWHRSGGLRGDPRRGGLARLRRLAVEAHRRQPSGRPRRTWWNAWPRGLPMWANGSPCTSSPRLSMLQVPWQDKGCPAIVVRCLCMRHRALGCVSRGLSGVTQSRAQPCGSCGLTSNSRRFWSLSSLRASVRWPWAM